LPAMQTPRTHWHRAEAIAGKPAPTESATCRSRACPRCRRRELTGTAPRPSQASQLQQKVQPVGAGLARDAGAANSRPPHRRHRRQASSNRARVTCRSRACPRCSRRELTATPPTPSQASLLQQKMQPVGAGLARDTDAANSWSPHRRHRRQASSNRKCNL
jgi:hypothetical protein